MVAAKAGVVLAMALAAGVLAVLGSLLSGRITAPNRDLAALSLSDGSTLRAYAGTAMYLGLISMLSLGISLAIQAKPLASRPVEHASRPLRHLSSPPGPPKTGS